ncbi:ribose-phosphate diphosphokinase [Mariprofundus erugo]|uniref:ribose-phosphate diphosphokinase n=1 Tax=Mariprofundus erugo TaxID=2528639 RepID=UPI0010FE3E20|nr:ribose-phosphate diphosphokinase [Mariprofundus erugo]TLS73607.1 ribose-phosphate diphosphokinase [Mariprofundus erugo]
MKVLTFPDGEVQAARLADALSHGGAGVISYALIEVHRFPDGESRVMVPTPLPEQVVIFCSLDRPEGKLIELLLAASAARDQGVKRLILVVPYLCYMRQDKAFHAGEAVSQRVIGKLLADAFDVVMTVDPHLHRVHQLQEAVPAATAIALSATGLMADFLQEHVERPWLLGPDAESRQWVEAIAAGHGFDAGVAEKERLGDSNVHVHLPGGANVAGRNVVLVDDVASTGRTLLAAAEAARAAGAASVSAVVTHALFAGDAWSKLRHAGFDHIWSTDSISHSSNVICLAPLLADAIQAV